MSVLSRVLGAFESKVADTRALTNEAIYGTPSSKAGVSVSIQSAWRVSAVAGCVRAVAQDVAQLPLKLMRESDAGKKLPVKDRVLYRVVHSRPNSWQTAMAFRAQLTSHAALGKGGYALVSRVDNEVQELLPAPYGAIRVEPLRDMTPRYWAKRPNGTEFEVPANQLLRIQDLTWNGLEGMAAYDNAKEAIGLAIATEESQAKLHVNGARPSGVLTTDSAFKSDETPKKIRDEWTAIYGGASATNGSVAVLDSGFKYQPLAMTGVDAETLASRKMQVEEVCRFFGVPPTRIGYSDKASTYASAAQFAQDYVTFCLMRWVTIWEQALSFTLLTEQEVKEGYFFQHEMKGILRGDHVGRSTLFKAALGTASSSGWMSPNDVRRAEDMDPSDQEGADEIMTPAKMAGKATPSPAEAGPDAEDDATA